MKKIIVFGKGSYGRYILNLIEILVKYEENFKRDYHLFRPNWTFEEAKNFALEYVDQGEIEKAIENVRSRDIAYYIGSKDPETKRLLAMKLESQGMYAGKALVHPFAEHDVRSTIGDGTVIETGVAIGENTLIGRNCSIGSNSVISNASMVDNFTTIRSGAHIGYKASVHQMVSIGENAVVRDRKTVMSKALIEPLSLVDCDIPNNENWGGNPIKKISNLSILGEDEAEAFGYRLESALL